MSAELVVKYLGFILAMIAFSYAFHQSGIFYIIPEGVYIGGVTAHQIFQLYRSLKATTLDFIIAGQVILLIPLIIGLLAFARLTKYRWLTCYPVAVLSGTGAGALFGLSIRGQLLGPVGDTVKDMMNAANDPMSRALFLVILIQVITLFVYSRTFSHVFERGERLYSFQRLGRILFMVVIGYQATGVVSSPTMFVQTVVKQVVDDIVRLFTGVR